MGQATLNGQLSDDGGEACTCHFDYGDTPVPGTPTDLVPGLITGDNFSATIYGLIPGNTYYFQAVATNSAGTTRGAITPFTIPLIPITPLPVPYGAILDDADLILLLEK